jgi:hypothetical protein
MEAVHHAVCLTGRLTGGRTHELARVDTCPLQPRDGPRERPQRAAVADGLWLIYFCRVLLGQIDERDYIIRA